MTEPMIQLNRDPEFAGLLPAVSPDTAKELERQLVDDGGPTDPIKTWNRTIIDGHRRHAICLKHDLPFHIEEMEFSNRDDAKCWIIRNQLARRNLSASEHAMAIAALADLYTDQAKTGDIRGSVANQVAKEAGVSSRTVYRAREFAKAVKALPEAVRSNLASAGASREDYLTVAKVPEESRDVVIGRIRSIKLGEPAPPGTKGEPGDRFRELFNLLGSVKKAIDLLSLDFPGAYYEPIMELLDQVSDSLSAWRDLEEI